ncbi:MAG: hypothetical protein IIA67_07735 [Planctomycetes bacterium]|nr:hypothetical protein [Planctomycetota bacterium]
MSSRRLTRIFALAADRGGHATDDDVRRSILRWIVVAGQAATLLITWRLWQVREAVPNLPAFDVPAAMQFSPLWPLLASLLAVLVRPRIGIALHSSLLLVAIALDQMRIQPEVISMAILLWGTLRWRGAGMIARAHLISLWFYAGLHKLLSPAYWEVAGMTTVGQTFPMASQSLVWAMATAVALIEITLAVLMLWPKSRKIAAWSAGALHIIIFLSLVLSEWNQAVWAWNLVLAVAGPLLFAWWGASPWAGFRTLRRVVQATIVFLLISPAGYYLGWIDAYLAHCLYASNTPRAVLIRGKHRGPSDQESSAKDPPGGEPQWLTFEILDQLNVPFPPAHRLYDQYFHQVAEEGDQMRIVDPRRWIRRQGLGDRTLTTEGEYRDGKKFGFWLTRHANGRRKDATTYVNGKPHGRWQAWHADGGRAEEGSFRDGLEHGQWTLWLLDGRQLTVIYEQGKQIAVRESYGEMDESPAHSP